jgi:hypothetical protein
MAYYENDAIGFYFVSDEKVEKLENLISIENHFLVKKTGSFILSLSVFFMNSKMANAIQKGCSNDIPREVRQRSKKIVNRLIPEVNYHINTILIQNALMEGHMQFFHELKKNTKAELEMEFKKQLLVPVIPTDFSTQAYHRLRESKISIMNAKKMKVNMGLLMMKEKAREVAQEELIQSLVKKEIQRYVGNFSTYLTYGAGFTLTSIILYKTVQIVSNQQKREEMLDSIVTVRGGFLGFDYVATKMADRTWTFLKNRLGQKVEEKIGDKFDEIVGDGKDKDSKKPKRKSNLFQQLTIPIPMTLNPISILAILLSLFVIQNNFPQHPIEDLTNSLPTLPQMPWAKKPTPTVWQKVKRFGGKLIDFQTPYPYIILIVGGGTIYFFSTSSYQRRSHSEAIVEISRQYAGALKHQFDSNMEYFKVLVSSVLSQSKDNVNNVKDYLKVEADRGKTLEKKLEVADEIQKITLLHESQLNITASLNTEKLKTCKNEMLEAYVNLDDLSAKSLIREQVIHDAILSSGNSGTTNTPALMTSGIQEKLNSLDIPKKTSYEERKADIEKRYPIEPQPKPLETMLKENAKLGKR